jgi:sulfate adenylyltransferase subunit 2
MKTEGLRRRSTNGVSTRPSAARAATRRRAAPRSASSRFRPAWLGSANQRPELWRLFNTRIKPGESMRVFPLSNWTELDVWDYIAEENIPSCRSISPRSGRWWSATAR